MEQRQTENRESAPAAAAMRPSSARRRAGDGRPPAQRPADVSQARAASEFALHSTTTARLYSARLLPRPAISGHGAAAASLSRPAPG
jgi:hypothetical protein